MINKLINLAELAGENILKIYKSDDFGIQVKKDLSPLTTADLISNEIILKGLNAIIDYPVVSEEGNIDNKVRQNWSTFWIVDPLDGTKDFIAQNDQFTVNIALINNNSPVLGIIYAPALKLMY